jgi:hypothetical protein
MVHFLTVTSLIVLAKSIMKHSDSIIILPLPLESDRPDTLLHYIPVTLDKALETALENGYLNFRQIIKLYRIINYLSWPS